MNRTILTGLAIVAIALALAPPASSADTTTEKEVTQHIIDSFADIRANSRDSPDTLHPDGALQFWSSGGLLQEVAADGPLSQYDSFNLHPKHIRVVTLVEGKAAVAMYYAEGSMTPKGNAPVTHYLTRVTEALVKENGKWQARAGHWSPIRGGAGTSQTAE